MKLADLTISVRLFDSPQESRDHVLLKKTAKKKHEMWIKLFSFIKYNLIYENTVCIMNSLPLQLQADSCYVVVCCVL